jgi:hypothetical protein
MSKKKTFNEGLKFDRKKCFWYKSGYFYFITWGVAVGQGKTINEK